MPVNMTPPVSTAAPASPAASALASAGATPASGLPTGAASAATPASPSSPADSQGAQGAQQAQSATNDPNAPAAAAQGDAFARLLEAQLGAMEATPGTAAAPGAPSGSEDKADTDGKPAKPQAQTAAADPNLLPNPALLALQQAAPVVPPPVVQAPPPAQGAESAQPAAGIAGAQADSQAARLAAQSSMPAPQAATDAKSEAVAAFSLAKSDDDGLQKLPQASPAQPTILPQAAAQQQAASEAQKNNATARTPTFNVPQHVGTPEWSKSVGDQVMAMVNLKADTAHIQVNPPQLGPIEVTLKMDAHNTAQVTFTADSPATRAALQDSLPKLHAMMAAGGIQLGDAQVSSGQSQRQQQAFPGTRNGMRNEASEGEEIDTLASIKAARGVLSIFA